jgi:hypothetical protein
MSTLEVNKITPVSGGTTVQVGESGDTINIPAGATIANAGTATGFGVSLANGADNRVVTASSASALNGESTLTFNGTTLQNNQAQNTDATIHASSYTTGVKLIADSQNSLSKVDASGTLTFINSSSERARIQSDGKFFVGTTVDGVYNDSSGAGGFNFNPTSTVALAVNNARPLILNRIDGDGDLQWFYSDGQQVGTISNSGSTVSYNSFAGSHWSRLADNSKPTILRGTVMESIATLCDWYQVKFTVSIDGKDIIKKESIKLPEGKSVGDIIKHTYQGVEYDAEILKEDNEQLPKCKISDTEDSKAVYGVFMDWDADDNTVNDMHVTALGAFVVRIHGNETIAIGDYLQSKGDGTAKKQADDILRASTIAKVTSTEKTHTYDDGSYCVPCTLHCG